MFGLESPEELTAKVTGLVTAARITLCEKVFMDALALSEQVPVLTNRAKAVTDINATIRSFGAVNIQAVDVNTCIWNLVHKVLRGDSLRAA